MTESPPRATVSRLRIFTAAVLAGAVATGGCGHRVAVPAAVAGSWGADCAAPFVTLRPGVVHVGPDKADYALTRASLAGDDLTLGYTGAAGAVVEHYRFAGDTLTLLSGNYGGQEATWHKAPMRRCS